MSRISAANNAAGRRRGTQYSIAAFLALILLAAGDIRPQSSGSRASSGIDRIHLGDIVDVDVVGSFEFDWRGGLKEDGSLDGLERLDEPVFALCRTEAEVAEAVAKQYSRILRSPEVVVRIVDRSNRAPAFLNGAVKSPHRFDLRRPARLIELIVYSGGITDRSNGEINIFRPPNVSCGEGSGAADEGDRGSSAARQFRIKIADLLSGDPKANIPILSGDIVEVNGSAPVFVTGGAVKPMRLNLTPDLTLSRAYYASGGSEKSSKRQKARIFRRGGVVIEHNLSDIFQNGADDPKLEPYDVIEIEREGAAARTPAPLSDDGPTGADSLSRLPLRIVD